MLGPAGARYLDDGPRRGRGPARAVLAHRARAHLRRTDGFAHVADIMVGSFYDPELDEGCAFEELICFHGGLGGPQTRPFILYPPALTLPPGPIIGAAAVHGVLRGWRSDLQGEPELSAPSDDRRRQLARAPLMDWALALSRSRCSASPRSRGGWWARRSRRRCCSSRSGCWSGRRRWTASTSRAPARPSGRWPRRRSRWSCSATPRGSTSASCAAGRRAAAAAGHRPAADDRARRRAAAALFGALSVWEAVILAIVLAPTDAALGRRSSPTSASRSGSARASTSRAASTTGSACRCCSPRSPSPTWSPRSPAGAARSTLLLEELGYGVLAGIGGGPADRGDRDPRRPPGPDRAPWRQVIPVAGARWRTARRVGLHGSGFIAAFVAGVVFRFASAATPAAQRARRGARQRAQRRHLRALRRRPARPGAHELSWELVLYAVLSLTVVRMVPVAIAMLGSAPAGPRSPSSAGSARAAWPRSSSR